MGDLLSPPSTNVPLVQDPKDPKKTMDLTPTWRKWIIDLVRIINRSGGLEGATPAGREIATVLPLAGGGDLTEDRELTFVPDGLDGDVQINDNGELGSVTGLSATIQTAKLTAIGSDGEMVFVNGILVSQVQAT